MKLTKPQRRILDQAIAGGKTVVGGRSLAAVQNLEEMGLVVSSWRIEHGGQQDRWSITVTPTEDGRRA